MSVVEELVRAREAYERRDWMAAYGALSDADPAVLHADDFSRLAIAALLLGRRNDSIVALQRAYRGHLDAGDPLGAVRCAFYLAMTLSQAGELAVASGWRGRAERLLAELPGDVVERGYLHAHATFVGVHTGDLTTAQDEAVKMTDYGRRFADPNLTAMGTCAQGRLRIFEGRVREGLGLLDEAMVSVATGELSPVFAGEVYCMTIEGCQEVSDLSRAAQWTLALTRWCQSQPDLVMFTGQCAVHRGQIMRLHGAYTEAVEEFERARERYLLADTPAPAGLALAERGDVLRILGDLDGAERSYAEAARCGHEPQPGQALLWLAQGRTPAALATVRRLLAEEGPRVLRTRLLPAAVEVLVAGDLLDEATLAADELDDLAGAFGCEALVASAAQTRGKLLVARGDGAAALTPLRQAVRIWRRLKAPYEAARCRTLVGLAYRLLADEDSAGAELAAAREAFTALGARTAERDVAALLGTAPVAREDRLSGREVEVLRLVAGGATNAQIAATLVLSEKTVARHLSNIFTKIDVGSRTAAAAYAYERGLV